MTNRAARTESASEASADVGTKLQLRPGDRPVRFQKPRLRREDYVGRSTYHVTLTSDRAPLFDDLELNRSFETKLIESAAKLRFRLLAYCFMPDHLHILAAGQDDSSDLLKLIQRFKQITGYYFRTISGDRPWQQSFFDRVLREQDHWTEVADYIFANPYVAGLPLGSPSYSLRGGDFFRDAEPDGAEASSLHFDSRGLSSGARYNPLEGHHEQPA